MNALTKLFSCLAIGVAAVGCSNSTRSTTVTNQLDIDRFDEITAVDMASLNLPAGESFVIVNSEGNEVPYQLTYDNLLIFPATVAAKGSAPMGRPCKQAENEPSATTSGQSRSKHLFSSTVTMRTA